VNESEIREAAASLVNYGGLARQMRKCLTLAQTQDSDRLAADEYMEYGDIIVTHQDYQDTAPLIARFYVGSVFSLLPSGKFYTVWANSNLEPCSCCKGSGCDYCGGLGSREAFEDELWYNAVDEIASKCGLWLESGEGEPCDLFLCMIGGD